MLTFSNYTFGHSLLTYHSLLARQVLFDLFNTIRSYSYLSASWRALVPLRIPIELIDDVNPAAALDLGMTGITRTTKKWTIATMTTPPCLPSTRHRASKLPAVPQSQIHHPHHLPLHFFNCPSLSGHIGTRPEIAGLRVQRADHLITPR